MSEQIEIPEVGIETPDATPTPVEGTPPATPSVVNLDDNALVELKINGQIVQRPWAEARTQMMLHGDYTRSKQELAEQRRAFEAQQQEFAAIRQQVEQRQALLQQVMTDPQKLSALVMAAAASRGQAAPAEPPTPQPLTNADLPTLQQQFATLAQQQIQAYMADQQRQVAEAQLSQDLDAHTNSLIGTDPILSKIPGVTTLLYEEVAKMGPKSIDEAKAFLGTVVDDWKARVGSSIQQVVKQDAVDKAKAVNGIEPKGGAPVPAQRKPYNQLTDDDIVKWLEANT